MAKRRKSRIQARGKTRKLDLAKIVRNIDAKNERAPRSEAQATFVLQGKLSAQRRALSRKMTPLVSGTDAKKAAPLIAQYNKDVRTLLRKQQPTARKAFKASNKRPHNRLISAQEAATAQLATLSGAQAIYRLQPFDIRSNPPGILWGSGTAQGGSYAKVFFSADSGDGEGTAMFQYFWTNRTPYTAVVNASCAALFRGVANTQADMGFFDGYASDLQDWVELQIYEYWKPGYPRAADPNYNLTERTHQMVFSMGSSGGSIFGDNDSDQLPLSRVHPLYYNGLVVPPQGMLVFRVVSKYSYWIESSSGFIQINLASRPEYGFRIPYLQVAVQNPFPPNPDVSGGGSAGTAVF